LSTLLMASALIIISIIFSGGTAWLTVTAVQSVNSADDAFTIPVTVQTYGNAWDAYLAFGLWNFPYDATGFSLTPQAYIVVMTTKGQLLDLRTAKGAINPATWMATYAPVKYIGQDTLMFEGEPDTSTHFWNLVTNTTTDFPNVYGHHDMIFNPTTGTFLTLWSYVRQIDGKSVLMDQIVELDVKGNVLWTWDTYSDGHFGLKDECPCNDTTVADGQTVIDLTHANSLQWDFKTNAVYMNMRGLDTFCKINKTIDTIVWCLGKHGDFTLLGPDGKQVPSLWYHAHDVREVRPDVFSMFDNDFDNTTNITNPCPATFEETTAHSRILEIAVNEENMTAWTKWSWRAPREDWTPYWGSVDRLPNGDWIAAFGAQSHFLPGTDISHPLPNSTGAVLVEVNQAGEVVRTYTFKYGWGIYRVVPIALQTINDYDGSKHTSDFTINLTTLNGLGGSTSIYYRINNGPTRSVATDGQPRITTQGANNSLEYWSVDNSGITESPRNLLTGIYLQYNNGSHPTTATETSETTLVAPASLQNSSTILEITSIVVLVALALFTIMVRNRYRKRSSKVQNDAG
jgi:hypothetical protein